MPGCNALLHEELATGDTTCIHYADVTKVTAQYSTGAGEVKLRIFDTSGIDFSYVDSTQPDVVAPGDKIPDDFASGDKIPGDDFGSVDG